MLIEIKNWYTGEVIFSLGVEYNSIKRTVEEAVKQGVDLSYANLKGANLMGADLRSADLRCADLSDSKLAYADLSGASLNYADIACADLFCANLSGANLNGVDLSKAKLCYATNVPDLAMACPREGSFIAWKKIWDYEGDYKGDFIVKLEIPEDAKRSSAATNKCRCSKAKVLEIKSVDTGECVDVITNMNRRTCVYKVGEYVYPDTFDGNRWNECSNGIHFFMTEQEAIDY